MKRWTASISILCFLLLTVFSGGCVNPFQQFYRPAVAQQYPPTQQIVIYRYTDEGLQNLLKEGYFILGNSTFVDSLQPSRAAAAFGRAIGADVILLEQKYTDSLQGAVAVPVYQPGYPYPYSGYPYGYGPYGPAYYPDPGYVTTTYIPYTINRYTQSAIFLRKKRGIDSKAPTIPETSQPAFSAPTLPPGPAG